MAPFEKVLNSLNYHEALIDGIIRSSNEAQGPLYKDTGHEVRLNVFLTNYAKRFLQACKFETQNCVTPTPNGQVV